MCKLHEVQKFIFIKIKTKYFGRKHSQNGRISIRQIYIRCDDIIFEIRFFEWMKKLPFDIFMHYFSSKFSELVITCKFSRKSSCIENFINTYLVFIWKVQFTEKMQCLWSQRDKTYAFTFKCTECKKAYLIWFFQESLSRNQDNHSLNCIVSLWLQSCLMIS